MSKIKFGAQIKKLIAKRHRIPEEFWRTTSGGTFRVIWFLDRQRPSIEPDYDFAVERFGVTKEGQIIWGFDSGCS